MSQDLLSLWLFHGRKHPNEKLDDWGFDGPCLGPLTGVHLAYGHVGVFGEADERIAIPNVDDLLFYGGSYFGDASIRPISEQPATTQVDERFTSVPQKLVRRWPRPINVDPLHAPEYLRRVEVFVDSVRELLGDAPAEAARGALSRFVKV
jgi:hypothetical protein